MKKKTYSDRALKCLIRKLDADFYFYSGEIDFQAIAESMDRIEYGQSKPNIALILTTPGGDPDAAYRFVRFLKRRYHHLTLYVFGFCKSAGTLAALGADKIVMSAHGELGPLDIQMVKPDEITERSSGLDISMAIEDLSQKAFGILETQFLELKLRSGGAITTKTAADIAQAISVGLLAPITSQIDPLKLGETCRAMKIAMSYGKRLNASNATLERLTSSYPCHSFAIDCEEAREIFSNVSFPNALELEFEKDLNKFVLHNLGGDVLRVPPHSGKIFFGKIEPKQTKKGQKIGPKEPIHEANDTVSSKAKVAGNGATVNRGNRGRKGIPTV